MSEVKSSLKISQAKFDKKEIVKLPSGAEIITKDQDISVKEIENGFIISVRTEIKYKAKGKDYTDYLYYTKDWYSKDNPITVDVKMVEKSIADLL